MSLDVEVQVALQKQNSQLLKLLKTLEAFSYWLSAGCEYEKLRFN